jgi:hypothetical protein
VCENLLEEFEKTMGVCVFCHYDIVPVVNDNFNLK